MATTSLTLGPHWEAFIKRELASGRFTTASEVVRAGLRELEERGRRLEALRGHLAEGAGQAGRGEFAETSVADILDRAKARAAEARAAFGSRRALEEPAPSSLGAPDVDACDTSKEPEP